MDTHSYPSVRVSMNSLVAVTIPGSSSDGLTLLPLSQRIHEFPSSCDHARIILGWTHTPTHSVRVSTDSLVTLTIPGSPQDGHSLLSPGSVCVSANSLVTVTIPGSSSDGHIFYPLCQSIHDRQLDTNCMHALVRVLQF